MDGSKFLRKSLLRLIFWIEVAFLKTEGLPGVDFGVRGVLVSSNAGVLSPVLLPASGCGDKFGFDWSIEGPEILSLCESVWKS